MQKTDRVHKERSKILRLGCRLSVDSNFASQHLLRWVDVEEARAVGEEEHSTTREEAFFLVERPAFCYKRVVVDEAIIGVLSTLRSESRVSCRNGRLRLRRRDVHEANERVIVEADFGRSLAVKFRLAIVDARW